MFDKIGEGAVSDDATVVEHDDPIAMMLCLFELMGRENEGDARIIEFGEHFKNAKATLGIDADGRFIEDEDARVVKATTGDVESTLHASREAFDEVMTSIVEAGPGQGPIETLLENGGG